MRNSGLDLMRGICAMGVVLYHMLYWKHGITILSLGTFTVYSFFILSACTLQLVYKDKFSASITRKDLKSFYQNRIARILPLLAAVSVIGFLVTGPSISSFIKLVFTGTGAFALHMPGYLSSTTGSWSLGIEIAFYSLFPILCILLKPMGTRYIVTITAITILMQQLLLYLLSKDFSTGSTEWWRSFVMPIMFAPFFLAGMIIERGEIAKVLIRMTDKKKLFLAAGIFSAMALYSLTPGPDLWGNGFIFLILELMAFCAVAILFTTNLPHVIEKIGGFFGDISYALYLTHWYVYAAITSIFDLKIFTIPVIVPVQILVAYGTYVFFEKPMRNRLRAAV